MNCLFSFVVINKLNMFFVFADINFEQLMINLPFVRTCRIQQKIHFSLNDNSFNHSGIVEGKSVSSSV